MPNGGLARLMILKPKSSDVVVVCNFLDLRVYRRDEWDTRQDARPLVELDLWESSVLGRFLAFQEDRQHDEGVRPVSTRRRLAEVMTRPPQSVEVEFSL